MSRVENAYDKITDPERARRMARVLFSDIVMYAGDQVRIGLWILAVLAMLTSVQRIYVAWDKLPRDASLDETKEHKT